MSNEASDGLRVACREAGCEREAIVWWKRVPLCAAHYQLHVGQRSVEAARMRAGEPEPGMNRRP